MSGPSCLDVYESDEELLGVVQESPGSSLVPANLSSAKQDEQFYDCQENAVTEGDDSHAWSVEHRARELLSKRDFRFEVCEQLVEHVCKMAQATRKRFTKGLAASRWVLTHMEITMGSYVAHASFGIHAST